MDLELIERLVKMLEGSSLDQLEVEQEGLRIRLQKYSGLPPSSVPQQQMITYPVAAPAQATPAAPAEAGPPPGTIPIESPMVGTFYQSPSPDAAPYVQVGDPITEDTVVCILEAMKVMNEIKAGVRGTIAEILIQNGQPVEYGQPMFLVKSSSV